MASPQLPLGSPGICEWKQNGAKGLGSLRVMGGTVAPTCPSLQHRDTSRAEGGWKLGTTEALLSVSEATAPSGPHTLSQATWPSPPVGLPV